MDAVHEWPKYPGGGEAFMKYLEELGSDMVGYLPKGTRKAYVQVEFIIDKDGVPVNFKVITRHLMMRILYNELISKMEKMPAWQPAILNDKPVAKKMVQTVAIELPESVRWRVIIESTPGSYQVSAGEVISFFLLSVFQTIVYCNAG